MNGKTGDIGISRRRLVGCGLAVAAASVIASGVKKAQAAPLTAFRPTGGGDFDHAAFDGLLQAHVRPDDAGYNRVHYAALKGRAGELKAYIGELEAATPSQFSRPAAHAYWINLYNAKTLDVVLDAYPVATIKDIDLGGGWLFGSGPWSRQLMSVEGAALTLDDVEHAIVRPLFADPLSHYGLNCASYSCPNLATRAYTSGNVDVLLLEGARAYVNHPRGVDIEGGAITASRIYAWYADDFGGAKNLKSHWMRYAAPGLSAEIPGASIDRYVYDWSLNDI